MKKFLVVLLVLALVAPAMAVSLTTADAGSGKLRISYNVPTGEVLRGVALKLSTTAGTATIAGTGSVTNISSFFDVFVDYAFSVPSGFTVDPRVGHPLADPAAAGQLTAFPASTYSLCMGVLDQAGNQAGVTGTGVLCEIQYVGSGSSATIKVEADTLRGGAVVGDAVTQPTLGDQVIAFDSISGTPSVVKNTAAPAIAARVNSGRTESFLASGVTGSGPIEYLFIWGDTPVNTTWGGAAQTHVYTYTAAAAYNVTVQARLISNPALVSAVSAPLALTTEEISSSAALYSTWAAFSRQKCWAFQKNCRGDADGRQQGTTTTGFWNVGTNDLNVLKGAWQIKEPTKGPGINALTVDPDGAGAVPAIPAICADFNRAQQGTTTTGFWRVGTDDLNNVLKVYWQIKEPTKGPGIPVCALGGTGGIIYYTPAY